MWPCHLWGHTKNHELPRKNLAKIFGTMVDVQLHPHRTAPIFKNNI